MRWLKVQRSKPLTGTITVPGSKNSSLGLLAACCLADEPVILKNIPHILDFKVIYEIGKDIGLSIEDKGDYMIIDPTNIHSADIDLKKSAAYRASYYFVGALLQKFKRVVIGYPGGDNFGERPIDQHKKGLEALGAKVDDSPRDHYVVEADELKGSEISFDVITSGATINVMLAAVKAEGKTVLHNAARDPEVVDIAIMLNKMGADIRGAGTDRITIYGVKYLKGSTHTAIPDRLIAGAFLMCVGLQGGRITVNNIIPEHLQSCTAKLVEAGIHIEAGDNYITASSNGKVHGVKVRTGMYPEFGTDFQQPLTAMLISADSHSVITETIFEKRFNHCLQLNRMGADIIIKDKEAVIPGNRSLKGSWVHATDVRAGIALVMAGLSAEGATNISGIEHIERGYPDIVKSFKALGAEVEILEDTSLDIDEISLTMNNKK